MWFFKSFLFMKFVLDDRTSMKQSVFTLFVLLLYMQLIAHIKVEFTVSVCTFI